MPVAFRDLPMLDLRPAVLLPLPTGPNPITCPSNVTFQVRLRFGDPLKRCVSQEPSGTLQHTAGAPSRLARSLPPLLPQLPRPRPHPE